LIQHCGSLQKQQQDASRPPHEALKEDEAISRSLSHHKKKDANDPGLCRMRGPQAHLVKLEHLHLSACLLDYSFSPHGTGKKNSHFMIPENNFQGSGMLNRV
jgi:hypothetical protein